MKESLVRAGADGRLGFQDALRNWQQDLVETLREHYGDLRRRGQGYVALIRDVKYEPQHQRIVSRCQGSASQPYMVIVEWDEDPRDPDLQLLPSCSCPYSEKVGLCKHTYAMTARLQREFTAGERSELVRSILGEDEPQWARALRQIDEYLKQPVTKVEHTAPTAKSQSRLAWRVVRPQSKVYDDPLIAAFYAKMVTSNLRLEVVVQAPSKRGGWNKGRVIDWSRFDHQRDVERTPADMAVFRAAGRAYGYSGPSHSDLGKALDALIGHPVVTVNDQPVEVRRAQFGLAINEAQQKKWTLSPAVDGRPESDFAFLEFCGPYAVAFDEVGAALLVAASNESLVALARSLKNANAELPKEAQAELLKRLPQLEERLPIALPDSMKGDWVEPDTRLRLRIVPREPAGAAIDLCVQPLADGEFFAPSDGPIEVQGRVNGERVRTERDLDDERLRAEALAKELFLHRFTSTGRLSWSIDGDDEVLDLLDTLRARDAEDPIVVWPTDGKVRSMNVLGEITASAMRVEIKDQHDWFGLSGSIELGGQKFPLAALLSALSGGRRYIDLGKGQFASISQAFRDRLAAVSDMLHSNRGKLEFNMTAVPAIADLLDEHVTVKASKTWKTTLSRLSRASDLDPQVPTTLTAELRDYQVEGYKWLRRLAEWGVGGILADDMGLGKTVQALAVLLERREIGPTLVIAPVSVGFNWVRETNRFTPTLRPILYRDTDRSEFLKTLGPGDLLISSYYLAQQHAEELTEVRWGTLVLDEAQNIKNSQTKTAHAVRELQADWRVALTGTPVENHLGELWSVFRGISAGLFGSWERFREVFAEPIEKAKDTDRKHALSRVLRPFVLRRTKSEVLTELPPRTEVELTAELSPAERKLYEDARLWAVTHLTDLVADTDKDQRFVVLAALTKLRQLACHPKLVNDAWNKSSAKLDLFLETVEELREGRHRALVFSQFTQHLALVRAALDKRNISYQYLDGQTPPKHRQERVDAFQRGDGDLFLISLKAGGTGLNLTGADYVIHLDPWWNPAVEDQATDRAHRIGQTRPVTVYRLVAKDTIEEQILQLHAEKRGLVASLLEGTDAAAKLSTKELVDLIRSGGKAT